MQNVRTLEWKQNVLTFEFVWFQQCVLHVARHVEAAGEGEVGVDLLFAHGGVVEGVAHGVQGQHGRQEAETGPGNHTLLLQEEEKASVAFFGPVNEGVHYFPEFVSFPRAQNHEKCFAHDHVPNVHTKSELSQVHTKCLQLYSDCER